MATTIARTSFTGSCVASRPTAPRRCAARNVVRSALETQRYATPYDGYK